MTNKPNSRGSEWRKWDLHVHPFKTKCVIPESNNEWFDFFKTVAKSDISAIGITDYFKFDIHIAFEKAKAEFLEDSQKFSQLEKNNEDLKLLEFISPVAVVLLDVHRIP